MKGEGGHSLPPYKQGGSITDNNHYGLAQPPPPSKQPLIQNNLEMYRNMKGTVYTSTVQKILNAYC